MKIHKCTKKNFDQIINNLNEYWEAEDQQEKYATIKNLHHPMMLYEFGQWAFVIKEKDLVVAYLFGLLSLDSKDPHGYVHMLATHKKYKGRGLATKLYTHFTNLARQRGCSYLKAITSAENKRSIIFYQKSL